MQDIITLTMDLKLSTAIVYPALCLLPLLIYIRYSRSSRLPPSPPSDPIIGHALRVPLTTPWKTFASWKERFGDVIYLHFYGSPKIVLNSLSAARDLLDKRSANFSGRPRQVVAGEMLGWNTSLPFLDYGDRFKRQRRLMQRYFDAQSVKSFSGIQERGVQLYLGELLRNPEDFRGASQRLVIGVVLRATYGYTIRSENDPLIDILHHATTEAAQIFYHGAITIEMLPILCYVPLWLPNWFPGVAGGRFAIKARANIVKAITVPFEELKSQKAAGVAEPCFISKLLDDYEEEQRNDPELQEDIKMLGAIAYTAGFESTWATILTFFLMMTLNQEVLKRAQEEIDNVVGADRLPTMNDRPNLPYIDCIVKEVFRINPIFAQGLDHKATESDHYRDWVIPKGALIVPNIWQMMRDEEYFPNPQTFSPDRYLENAKVSVSTEDRPKPTGINADPSNFVFGFGRRICPGRFFAEGTIWLTIASTLAVFNIKPITDPITGNEILPIADYSEAPPISFPKPFKCSITPRSEKHAQLIRDGPDN